MSEQSEKILIDLLKKAPKEVMDTLSKRVGVTDTKLKRGDIVNQIIDHAFNNGCYEFVGKMSQDDLLEVHQEAGVKMPEKKDKDALIESFFDEIERSGLEELLQKLKPNTLQQINIKIGAESEGTSSAELAVDVAGQILFLGCKPLFKELTEVQLKEFCLVLGLSGNGTKESKANRILNVAFPGVEETEDTDVSSKKKKTTNGKSENAEEKSEKPEKKAGKKASKKKITKEESSEDEEIEEKKEKSKPKESKKRKHVEEDNNTAESSEPKKSRKELDEEIKKTRKPLEKGITKEEIFQGYWNDELKEFCTKNKISAVGKKKDIINRIVQFLENPSTFSEEKQKKGRGRKSQTKQTDTAASDQTATTPSTSTSNGVQ